MSDPERPLTNARSLEALLLESARDETPPPELLASTLAKVGVAGASAAVTSAAASTTSAAASRTGAGAGRTRAAASTASAAAPATAGGGLLGAIAIGAVAGLLTVGVADWVLGPETPPRQAPAAVAPAPPKDALRTSTST